MMDDQKILDNAPVGFYTSVSMSNGKPFIWTCNNFRSLADIKDLVKLREANAELEKGYEELRMATLWAVQLMSGGQAKADLRDAYDKSTEQLEALKADN